MGANLKANVEEDGRSCGDDIARSLLAFRTLLSFKTDLRPVSLLRTCFVELYYGEFKVWYHHFLE